MRHIFDIQPLNIPAVKRTVKDTVFTDLFSDPKYLFQLYQALYPGDHTTKQDDLKDVTLKSIIADSPYNDLGFRVGESQFVLFEEQSTWSVNIIIRILMYLMQSYNNYFKQRSVDLYGSKKAHMPKPELIVLYVGTKKEIPEIISLKDEFFGGEDTALDARVRIITDGNPGDIINQYVTFTMIHRKLLEESKSNGEDGRVIAKKIVEKCIEQNVLKDYMKSREVEVMDIMTTLFDQEYVTMVHEKNKIEDKIQEMLPELKKRAAEEAKAEAMAEAKAEAKAEAMKEARSEIREELKEKDNQIARLDDKIAVLEARIAELTKDN